MQKIISALWALSMLERFPGKGRPVLRQKARPSKQSRAALRFIGAAAALVAAIAPAAAWAAKGVEARLAAPVSEPRKFIVDGRVWSCEDDICRGGTQGANQSIKRECTRAAKVLGPIVAYRNGDKTLSAEEIAACNAS